MTPRCFLRRLLIALTAVAGLVASAVAVFLYLVIAMPGDPLRGELPPADDELLSLAERLRGHVDTLALTIGERNAHHMAALAAAADYIREQWNDLGYDTVEHRYGDEGFRNLWVEIPGRAGSGLYVVTAHYDSALGTPGADDNASGVAALLELARSLAGRELEHGIRLVAVPNEERPYFGTELMGSLVDAARAHAQGLNVLGMFSLEMLGFYSDAPGSQLYPPVIREFYPDRGNFIALVGNFASRGLLHEAISHFRAAGAFRSEGMAAPEWLVEDIRRSDNASWWHHGFPALMITDTSNFRNPHYHTAGDLPHTLDYLSLARVVRGLEGMLLGLAED